MIRELLEEATALIAISMFVGAILIWSAAIGGM